MKENGQKKVHTQTSGHKRAGVAVLISDKIDIKIRHITRDIS